MARFTLPRDIYYGEGAISELKNLKGCKRAIVVTGGSSMKKGGFLQKVEDVCKSIGMEVKLFEGVEPDPSIETVFKGAKAMEEFQPDVIIAIGGGSPIDAAKAMWVFYEYPDKKFDDIKDPFTMPKLRTKAIFVAIPSTSGTASEVTAFSVITDYSTNIKYPLADFEITPDIAILDTDIPLTMPKKLTAHTGIDALTHAIEAYVATARSAFSDPLALQAISDIFDCLIDSYNGDKEARAKMHYAQCLAGMSFSNALLGIAHSLAHKTGAVFEIPHGCCNAILLPAGQCPDRRDQRAQQKAGHPAELSGQRRLRGAVQGQCGQDRRERGQGSLHRLQPSPDRRGEHEEGPHLRLLWRGRHLLIGPTANQTNTQQGKAVKKLFLLLMPILQF